MAVYDFAEGQVLCPRDCIGMPVAQAIEQSGCMQELINKRFKDGWRPFRSSRAIGYANTEALQGVVLQMTFVRNTECPFAGGMQVEDMFSIIGANSIGIEEYVHKDSGILFVRIPNTQGVSNLTRSFNMHEYEGFDVGELLVSKSEITNQDWSDVMGSMYLRSNNRDSILTGESDEFREDCMAFCKAIGCRLPNGIEALHFNRKSFAQIRYEADNEHIRQRSPILPEYCSGKHELICKDEYKATYPLIFKGGDQNKFGGFDYGDFVFDPCNELKKGFRCVFDMPTV